MALVENRKKPPHQGLFVYPNGEPISTHIIYGEANPSRTLRRAKTIAPIEKVKWLACTWYATMLCGLTTLATWVTLAIMLIKTLYADLIRCWQREGKLPKSRVSRAVLVATEHGAPAVITYRLGYWARKVQVPGLVLIARVVNPALAKCAELVSGVHIHADAEIGPGLLIEGGGGVVLAGRIGRDCTVGPGAQILAKDENVPDALPTIGDGVFIGAGAKVIGPVLIGDGAVIGANAVVLESVPAGATVVGVPARVVKVDGVRVEEKKA